MSEVGENRTVILDTTKRIIKECVRLEDLIGWVPWEDSPDVDKTRSERLSISQNLQVLVEKLLMLQGFSEEGH